MKMKTFSSYAEILAATEGHQVTGQELINGRTYITGEGWQDIELTPEFKHNVCEELANVFGGRTDTKKSISAGLYYGKPQHWGLRRVFIENYNGKQWLRYYAGQNHPAELKTIRAALK